MCCGIGWGGGKGRRLPICCNLSLVPFHWSLGGMAGPADRPASGAHLFPGPGRHRDLRHSRSGLLLSELGAHVLCPGQAPAGTKRLSNLLRSPKWCQTLLERFLWQRADQELTRLEERSELALAIWDESVLEKPESIALEGLCPRAIAS